MYSTSPCGLIDSVKEINKGVKQMGLETISTIALTIAVGAGIALVTYMAGYLHGSLKTDADWRDSINKQFARGK